MSTWAMIIGGVIAALDSNMLPTGILDSVTGQVSSTLAPIDSKLPIVQNVGVWVVAAGAIMRFGFGK
jgi:uncharacterized paraquat-inducible protein A